MSQLLPPPDREIFERQLQNIYSHGDQDTLARLLKKSRSRISQMINPFSDTESIQHRAAWWQFATDCISLEKGDLLFAMLKLDYESRRLNRLSLVSTGHGTAEIGRKLADLFEAELSGFDGGAQLRAIVELEMAVTLKKQQILSRGI